MKLSSIQAIVAVLATLAISLNVSLAHQQKEAYITILLNANTGNLEVSHRFLLHDAEHVVAQLGDLKSLELSGDVVSDERSQAALAAYIESHFELANEKKESIQLRLIGYEVEGKYFWLYQETPIPDSTQLNIKHSALQELWQDQINHVNVEQDGKVGSVRLSNSDMDRWHTIDIKIIPQR